MHIFTDAELRRPVVLGPILSDKDADALSGTLLTEPHVQYLLRGSGEVRRPDGSLLVAYHKDVLPANLCAMAYKVLREAATPTDNRGVAAGPIDEAERLAVAQGLPTRPNKAKVTGGRGVKFQEWKQDGTVSRQNRAALVNSGIIGYMDRTPRFPYCRQTAFTMTEASKYAQALPFARAVSAEFRQHVPLRYAAQEAFISRTSPDFVIPGTVFTTITVNKNWQTAVHKDAGDLKQGCGVMAVLQAGIYEGGYLCFPKYGVAVDMRLGGVCFADVHEWHGNTPIIGKPGRYERVSCVFYYREHMEDCGSASDEVARVKRRKMGTKLHGGTL